MSNREWRVLVVDDEPAARRGVRQLLAAFPEFVLAGECRDGREAADAVRTLRPDVVFLDVHMPEADGFEVVHRASEPKPLVVFLTAYDQFAVRAFEAEAVDYLVKPVAARRFAQTIDRLRRRLGPQGAVHEPTFIVPMARGPVVVQLHDVDWIEAADYYARLWTGSRSYLLRESLDDLERRVVGHGFVRAHRRALLRLAMVSALHRTSRGECVAILRSGAQVPVSRRRRAAVAAALRALAATG